MRKLHQETPQVFQSLDVRSDGPSDDSTKDLCAASSGHREPVGSAFARRSPILSRASATGALLLGASTLWATASTTAAPNSPGPTASRFERRLVAVESTEPDRVDGEEISEEEQEEAADKAHASKFAFFSGDISPLEGSIQQTTPQPINLLNPISGESKEGEPPSGDDASPEAQRERIVREFGDPDEEIPILGDEKAPKPFRGMMHALEAGNKELAFQYARSYVRYINKVKDRTSLVTQLAGLGGEIEGTQPREDHSEEPDPAGYLDIYRKELDRAVKDESAVLSLSPEARELLERANGEAGESPEPTDDPAHRRPLGEAAERALVYENHPGGLPVDPNGRVTVYYFLSVSDKGPNSMLADVQRLYEAHRKSANVQVKGISLVSRSELGVHQFKFRQPPITFPIEENKELAAVWGIVRTPAVVVVAETEQKMVIERGHRTFLYLDELVRFVSGRRTARDHTRAQHGSR